MKEGKETGEGERTCEGEIETCRGGGGGGGGGGVLLVISREWARDQVNEAARAVCKNAS
jgi:hypothetical protein